MSQPSIADYVTTWKNNLVRNTSSSFTEMQAQHWIRLVVVVGAYLLIRPYLVKLGARMQEKSHQKTADALGVDNTNIHPNDLRGGKKQKASGAEDSDEETLNVDEDGTISWGKRAKVRQRKFIKGKQEEAERKLREEQEAESDKEIEDLLIE